VTKKIPGSGVEEEGRGGGALDESTVHLVLTPVLAINFVIIASRKTLKNSMSK